MWVGEGKEDMERRVVGQHEEGGVREGKGMVALGTDRDGWLLWREG